MSVEHYWPLSGEVGTYDLETVVGNSFDWEWTGTEWLVPEDRAVRKTTEQLKAMGYLGVRREQPEPDNAAIAKQALAELRLCRKPFETERWAYEWGPKLCQMLGAE